MSVGHVHAVLIVDDDGDLREAIVALLELEGFEAVAVPSAEEALALFALGYRPCVILLDVHMPEMDGWQLWEHMRANGELARLSVVVLSSDHADQARARTVGIRQFLRKPIRNAALIKAVERHCDRRA